MSKKKPPKSPPKERPEEREGLLLDERPKVDRPRKFKVLMHNDDYTTMEFVIQVLMDIFKKDRTEATFLMLMVHRSGVAVCGVYPRDIAETKVEQTVAYAREHGHPLMCTMEAE